MFHNGFRDGGDFHKRASIPEAEECSDLRDLFHAVAIFCPQGCFDDEAERQYQRNGSFDPGG